MVVIEEGQEVDRGVDPLPRPPGTAFGEPASLVATASSPQERPERKGPNEVGVLPGEVGGALVDPPIEACDVLGPFLE